MDNEGRHAPVTNGEQFFLPRSHAVKRLVRRLRWIRLKRRVEPRPPKEKSRTIVGLSLVETLLVVFGFVFALLFEIGTLASFIWNYGI